MFAGNRYNLRLWIAGFKTRIRDCLRAQINAIMAREGLSATGGIIGLTVVFIAMTYVATHNANDPATLVALAATLPRQIEMTNNVHELASGWNDVLAVWTRVGDVVANMRPSADPHFDQRIKFDRLLLRSGDHAKVCHSVEEAVRFVDAEPTGRITVRGGNGSGKSTLLAALKAEIKNRAYYWPTTDRLAFDFAAAAQLDEPALEEDGEVLNAPRPSVPAFHPASASSSRCRRSLRTPMRAIYLLDEWDANLDQANRADRRRAGRAAGDTRPRGRDFAPRPGVKGMGILPRRGPPRRDRSDRSQQGG